MKLVQLQYFVTACQRMNISMAAQELHISQPSVSNAIRELEKEFGVQLFYRNNRTLALTSEGKFLYDRAVSLLESAQLLQRQMCDLGANRNNIRIGIPPMIGSVLYPSLVQDFNKEFPRIYTDIFEQGSAATIQMVQKGTLDAALVVIDDISERENLSVIPVMETQILFCVNKGLATFAQEPLGLNDIRDHPIVMYREGYYLRKILLKRYQEAGIEPKIILNTNQLYTAKNVVISGMASAFFFQEIVAEEDDIVGFRLKEPLFLHIGLVWKRNGFLYSDVAKFLNFVKKYRFSF